MTLTTLAFLSLVCGSPSVSAPDDVFSRIDALHHAGAIDVETRHRYRVAAVRQPALLPDSLRDAPKTSRRSLTPIFLEAARWVEKNQAWGGPLHQLLLPPDDLAYVLQSSTHNLRVSYGSTSQQNLAQWALDYAEISWDVLTLQYGFWAPPIEPGAVDYRIYITSTNGHGSAYTAPYDPNPATDHTDYFTYVVVDPGNGEFSISGTMAHEFTHACQASMDVQEPTVFWENTATYIMSRVFPDQLFYTVGTMPYFQQQPWRALEYMNRQQSDTYEYGGGLFVWYLVDTYAPSTPESFVADIWLNCVQNQFFNEPDYYDAIETVIADRGGDDLMEDVLLDFAEARYFVASNDDGQHITNAYLFNGAEVALAARHDADELPLYLEEPPAERWPYSFGVNHVRVDIEPELENPIRVRIDGDNSTRWAARAVLLGDGLTTESTDLPLAADTWDATVEVQPAGHDRLLLVVANLGEDPYDPDLYDTWNPWPRAGYRYTVERVMDPPSDMSLDPDVVERGQQGVFLELYGTGFVAGGLFDLEFTDPDIQVSSIDRVQAEQVSFRITVPMLTELGAKTLIVTNRDGQQSTAEDILTIVDRGELSDGGPPDDEPKSGCGCRTGDAGGAALWIGLLGLLWAWRRRR